MYSIPEHPAEGEFIEEGYSEISASSTTADARSGSPLPDPDKDNSSSSTASFQRDVKRLSVSLFDIPRLDVTADSGTFKADNGSPFANISEENSKSYLEVRDCISHSNEAPLSNASDHLVFVDLDEGSPSVLRGRSRSVQWIQNTFQNVSSKYKWLLEIRRPSDIVEERMRRSRDELEMDEAEYDSLAERPSGESRRFSETKKRFFPRLKDLWRDNRRQEEKDSDQNRPDVCPLFTFPRKGDEDEQILDALRQAMRKCTVVDPTARPTSSTVLDQLSKLLD